MRIASKIKLGDHPSFWAGVRFVSQLITPITFDMAKCWDIKIIQVTFCSAPVSIIVSLSMSMGVGRIPFSLLGAALLVKERC